MTNYANIIKLSCTIKEILRADAKSVCGMRNLAQTRCLTSGVATHGKCHLMEIFNLRLLLQKLFSFSVDSAHTKVSLPPPSPSLPQLIHFFKLQLVNLFKYFYLKRCVKTYENGINWIEMPSLPAYQVKLYGIAMKIPDYRGQISVIERLCFHRFCCNTVADETDTVGKSQ